MSDSLPPLKQLHLLVCSKIVLLEKISTELLLETLAPGSRACLKTRSDGTILDGHDRMHALRMRNIDVNRLPREVMLKEDEGFAGRDLMFDEFHSVAGPWPGKLLVAARPRGGDWLEDEIRRWRGLGVSAVLSLLNAARRAGSGSARRGGSYPRSRHGVFICAGGRSRYPPCEAGFAYSVEWLDSALAAGQTVVVHCRHGIGRSGMAAACVLILNGCDPATAIGKVSSARDLPVPETEPQREWIGRYAANLVHAK